jgi:hypothetical protein
MSAQQGGLSLRRALLLALLGLCILLSCVVVRPAAKRSLIAWLRSGALARHGSQQQPRRRRRRRAAAAAAAQQPRQLGSSRHALEDAPAPAPDGLPIPNVVHMIFGLSPDFGHMKFGLTHYLAVLGARLHIAPAQLKWHYRFLPDGVWWECARPALTLHKVEDVTHVHGRPKAMRVQHKADVLRMQLLLGEGGMYIDSDVIPLRSFQDLRKYPLVMGQEEAAGQSGLANAVILAAPNTTFMRRWWGEYASFEPDKQWAYHSVILPRALHGQHPGEVTALSGSAFFKPCWTDLTAMYDADDGYSYRDNYAVHLWTSADANKQELLRRLSVGDIFRGRGSFQRRARQLLVEAAAQGQLCGYAAAQVAYYAAAGRGAEGVLRDWPGAGGNSSSGGTS